MRNLSNEVLSLGCLVESVPTELPIAIFDHHLDVLNLFAIGSTAEQERLRAQFTDRAIASHVVEVCVGVHDVVHPLRLMADAGHVWDQTRPDRLIQTRIDQQRGIVANN